MSDRRTAYLVYNPAAGRGGLDDLETILRALKDTFEVRVGQTSPTEDSDVHARRARALGADLVIAAGGDGTASMVASELVGSAIPLGVLPRGTASAFAAALGIPADLEAALAVLTQGEVRSIDTALANDRVMLLTAALGFHADAILDASRATKNRFGMLSYLASGLKHLMQLEPFEVEAELEEVVVRCLATSVTVANAAPSTTLVAQGPPRISPGDGLLDVTIIASEGFTEALATGLHLWRSAVEEAPATRDKVGYLSTPRITLRTRPDVRALIDGEPAGTSPLTVICRPRSLRVLVPQALRVDPPVEDDLSRLPGIEVELKENAARAG